MNATINIYKDGDDYRVTTSVSPHTYQPFSDRTFAFAYACGFKDALHKTGYKVVEVNDTHT